MIKKKENKYDSKGTTNVNKREKDKVKVVTLTSCGF